jgi:hypothetical protein
MRDVAMAWTKIMSSLSGELETCLLFVLLVYDFCSS